MTTKKHFLLSIYLSIIALSGLLYFSSFDVYKNEATTKLFMQLGLWVGVAISGIEIWFRRAVLFTENHFRNLITVLGSVTASVYAYNHKTVLGLSIALLLLCVIYGVYKKTFYKPHPIMVLLFVFCSLKLVSVFWYSKSVALAFSHIDYYVLLWILPVVSCFYRIERKELNSFIYMCFVLTLPLLVLTFVSYLFLTKHLNEPLLSFISFDKNYLSINGLDHYATILWSKTYHQSKIAWLFLLVFSASYWLWRRPEKNLSAWLLVFYFVLCNVVSFILQARVTILGMLIIIGVIGWVELMKQIKLNRWKIICTLAITLIGSLFLIKTLKYNPFFKDEYRKNMNTAALKSFYEQPFFGGGARHEKEVIQHIGYEFHTLHNDFLSTMVELGLFGLFFLLAFHGAVVYFGLKQRFFLGVYVLLAFVIFNSTEGVLGLPICVPFFLFCLIPLEKNTKKIE